MKKRREAMKMNDYDYVSEKDKINKKSSSSHQTFKNVSFVASL
jgi:hypothetical protein